MSDTVQYALPLLAASQAQKHVTVNEALVRIDALVRPRVISMSETTPPATPAEGDAYVVPVGAGGDWSGHAGEIAFWLNGGWEFGAPRPGWRGHDQSGGTPILCDGTGWSADAVAVSAGGAATLDRIVEIDHEIGAGTSSTTVDVIPAGASVLGVSARVIVAISGDATSWSLGVSGSTNRYGSGLGLPLNSYAAGLTAEPLAYYADTPLVLTAAGGSFAGGTLRIAVHLRALQPPRAV